jgi:glycosyltransferase involved in cell wall biosynthesis
MLHNPRMTNPDWPNLSGKTILQVIPDLAAGGAERTTVEMAEAITGAGGQALVLSAGGRLEDDLEKAGGTLIKLNAASKNPLTIRKNAKAIEKIVAERGVDLIHARSRAPAWSAYMAAQRIGTPFATTYHGAYSGLTGLKRRYNSVMAKGELIIANSEWTAAHVMAVHSIPKERIVTIPRGVDFAAFTPENVSADRIADMRAAWGIGPDDDRIVLLLPGRLTSWKGQSLTIDALAALDRSERSQLHLIWRHSFNRWPYTRYASGLSRRRHRLGAINAA